MELIRATSPLKGRFFIGSYKFSLTRTVYLFAPAIYSLLPGLGMNFLLRIVSVKFVQKPLKPSVCRSYLLSYALHEWE